VVPFFPFQLIAGVSFHPGSFSCLKALARASAISPGPLTTLWKNPKWAMQPPLTDCCPRPPLPSRVPPPDAT
jgi:hypothetical protein